MGIQCTRHKRLDENEMDTVLKRALHYLECYAALYPLSGADAVETELRQLITETKAYQVKGETLSFEPPKWEYRMIKMEEGFNKDHLNHLGDVGWEMIMMDIGNDLCVFKRSK